MSGLIYVTPPPCFRCTDEYDPSFVEYLSLIFYSWQPIARRKWLISLDRAQRIRENVVPRCLIKLLTLRADSRFCAVWRRLPPRVRTDLRILWRRSRVTVGSNSSPACRRHVADRQKIGSRPANKPISTTKSYCSATPLLQRGLLCQNKSFVFPTVEDQPQFFPPAMSRSRPPAARGKSGGLGSTRSGKYAWQRRPGCFSRVLGHAADIASKTSAIAASAPNLSASTASRYRPIRGQSWQAKRTTTNG